MKKEYPALRQKFNIPDSHILKKGAYEEKDRATFSIEKTEIIEYDENGNTVAKYIQEERIDATGCYTNYYVVDNTL